MVWLFHKELWRKPLSSWYLYDFANSLLIINANLYFSQWIVVDKGIPDFFFALPFMIATALLLFVSPYVGYLGDKNASHHKIFIFAALATVASSILMWASARYAPIIMSAILALIAYGLYQFFAQLVLVPYTAFIKTIAPKEHYGAVSGLGFSFGQLGNIFGLLLTLPITYGVITFFGTDRIAVLLPATVAFLLFATPSFFYLRTTTKNADVHKPHLFKTLWHSVKESKKYPGVFELIIAFYFFSDALMSISLFGAIYLQNVYGAPDTLKVPMYLLAIGGMFAGALLGGVVADKKGHRFTMITALCCTVIMILFVAFASTMYQVIVSFSLFGFFSGAVYSSSRAYLALIIPEQESGRFFGLYELSERFASIVGPAIWGVTVWLLRDFFPWNYRAAVITMALLATFGLIPLLRKKSVSATI